MFIRLIGFRLMLLSFLATAAWSCSDSNTDSQVKSDDFNTPKNIENMVKALSWIADNSRSYRTLYKVDNGNYTIIESPEKTSDINEDFRNDNSWIEQYEAYDKYRFLGAPSSYEFWQAAYSSLPEQTQQKLTNLAFDYGTRSGIVLNYARYMLPSPFSYYGFNIWYDDEQLKQAFLSLDSYKDGEGVKWSAELERFAYEDEELLSNVLIIASKVWKDPKSAAEIFEQLPVETQARLKYNTQENTPASKTEPFDLVQGEITRWLSVDRFGYLIDNQTMTRVMITKLVHAGLHKVLKVDSASDTWGANLNKLIILPGKEDKIKVFCSGNEMSISNIYTTLEGHLIIDKQIDRSDILEGGLTVTCGEESAKLTRAPMSNGEELSSPKPYDIEKILDGRDFEVVTTFALNDETTPEFIGLTKAYMSQIGWSIESENTQVDTKKNFVKSFKSADAYIPIAHLLDVSNMHIGATYSHEITFTKGYSLPTGAQKTVRLTAFLPIKVDGSDNYFAMNGKRLRQLLMDRRVQRRDSMVILNASCQSAHNTRLWTNAYRDMRDSLNASPVVTDKIFDDTPHVFGSNRNFPTSSESELISNFAHPMTMIDSIMSGIKPEQLTEIFNQPVDDFYIDAASKLLGIPSSEIQNDPYEAVYNVSNESIMQSRLQRVRVEKSKDGAIEEDFTL